MSKVGKNIIVLGAYGFTGKLIVQRLASAGYDFTIAGRDRIKLIDLNAAINAHFETYVFDCLNPDNINDVVARFDVVINCIGPYNIYCRKLLHHVADSGKVYFDICGEQSFIMDSFSTYSGISKSSGTCIVHSLSFESCLSDMVASDFLDDNMEYDEISAFYFFRNDRTSRGTKFSMQVSKHFPCYIYSNKAMVPAKTLSMIRERQINLEGDNRYAAFIPNPDVLFFSKRYNVQHSGTYLMLEALHAETINMYSQQAPKSMEEIIASSGKRKFIGPESKERENQQFELLIFSKDLNGVQRNISVKGKDPYMITATFVERALMQIVHGGNEASGHCTPAEFFGSGNELKEMAVELELEISEA